MVPARRCSHCGQPFVPQRRSDATTCSAACRKGRSRARKATSAPAISRAPQPAALQLDIVVLVAESRAQQLEARPARQLFTGEVFTAAAEWATRLGTPWAVLSTRYGLVFPDTRVQPYEVLEPDPKRDRLWARAVNDQLRETFPPGTVFVVLGSRRYCEVMEAGTPLLHTAPLRGLSASVQLELFRMALGGEEPLLTRPLVEFVFRKVGSGEVRGSSRRDSITA